MMTRRRRRISLSTVICLGISIAVITSSSITIIGAVVQGVQGTIVTGTNNNNNNDKNEHDSAEQQQWRSNPNEFPVPVDGVGDPDNVLSVTAHENIAQRLAYYSDNVFLQPITSSSSPSSSSSSSNKDDDNPPVQLAVAIVDRIDPSLYEQPNADVVDEEWMETNNMDDAIEDAVGKYARDLHNHWGIGHVIRSEDENNNNNNGKTNHGGGGTGVLLFLDVYDRIVYISRGSALNRRLNDGRIDHIIHHEMRPYLRQAQYEQGIIRGIDEIVEYIQKGDPTMQERIADLFRIENLFVLVWVGILGNGIFHSWKRRRDQRLYAQAYSQLSEIDRAHAEALQGNYEATSCPICLESFQSNTIGSDGRPIKLLRCGHVFDEGCWEEWVASGNGDPTKCPVCRVDVGLRPDCDRDVGNGSNNNEAVSDPTTQNDSATEPDVSSNDDVPTDFPSAAPTAAPTTEPLTRQGIRWDSNAVPSTSDGGWTTNHSIHPDNDHERSMRQFQQERNFRLLRLAQMYPRFITTNNVRHWTSPTYHGTMVRDPSFTTNDPLVQYRHHQQQPGLRHRGRAGHFGSTYGSSGFGGSGMGFGGGTSGGGRSGRF